MLGGDIPKGMMPLHPGLQWGTVLGGDVPKGVALLYPDPKWGPGAASSLPVPLVPLPR